MTKAAEENTTYLLVMQDGSQKKVTVPASWKVTFGALYPGKEANHGKTGLRFYSAMNKQHAVFTDVASFRDASIKLEERISTRKEETFYKDDGDNQKAVVVEGVVHEWVDPDHPPEKKAQGALRDLRVVNLDN